MDMSTPGWGRAGGPLSSWGGASGGFVGLQRVRCRLPLQSRCTGSGLGGGLGLFAANESAHRVPPRRRFMVVPGPHKNHFTTALRRRSYLAHQTTTKQHNINGSTTQLQSTIRENQAGRPHTFISGINTQPYRHNNFQHQYHKRKEDM